MTDEIIRKMLSIDDTPDCYFHHIHGDDNCNKCLCEIECAMEYEND